jgi:hypothetical protein
LIRVVIKELGISFWLISVVLTTREAEIRRIVVGGQSGQIVCETLSSKKTEQNGLKVWLK